MQIASDDARLSVTEIGVILSGLPEAAGYRLLVKPLRYRTRPRLAAWTDFEGREITIQLPEPFLPFGEVVNYAAKRRPGRALRFLWLSEGVTFRTAREVLRFLYCHEWMHWYLREVLGRRAAAETACDRFALGNYLRDGAGIEDARAALRRKPLPGGAVMGPTSADPV